MNYLQLPVEVLPHLRRLSAVQLAIWADAWTWQQNGKEARRSNAQYGEMFGVHAKSISQSIAGLRDAGCIEWLDTGGGRVLRATIPTNVTPPYQRVPSIGTSIHTNVDTPSIGTCTPPPYEHGAPLHTNVDQIEKVIENVIENEIDNGERTRKAPRLKRNGNTVQLDTKARPFDLAEVVDYFLEIDDTEEEANQFWDYWESAGWRRKNGPIRDWKASARTWIRSPYRKPKKKSILNDAMESLKYYNTHFSK